MESDLESSRRYATKESAKVVMRRDDTPPRSDRPGSSCGRKSANATGVPMPRLYSVKIPNIPDRLRGGRQSEILRRFPAKKRNRRPKSLSSLEPVSLPRKATPPPAKHQASAPLTTPQHHLDTPCSRYPHKPDREKTGSAIEGVVPEQMVPVGKIRVDGCVHKLTIGPESVFPTSQRYVRYLLS